MAKIIKSLIIVTVLFILNSCKKGTEIIPGSKDDENLPILTNVKSEYILIPDRNFEKYLIANELDKDKLVNGKISVYDANLISHLYLEGWDTSDAPVKTLKGIEFFPYLQYLDCPEIGLTELDLSKNIRLNYLNCNGNNLGKLDISSNPKLRTLSCVANNLANLNLTKNPLLTLLNCSNNKLSVLDLSNQTLLQELICSNNQLQALDVSKLTKLKVLLCYFNKLASLDVSQNLLLEDICCQFNFFKTVDLCQHENLQYIGCHITDENFEYESFTYIVNWNRYLNATLTSTAEYEICN